MNAFQRLYQEIQLREKTDLTARLLHVVATATGSFKRRLPVHEMTTREFLSTFPPGRFETVAEFIADHSATDQIWQDIPADLIPDSLVEEADRIIDQKFSFLGAEHQFHGAIDWHHSLISPKSWPRGHWSEIPFRSLKGLGDIKACWEMNRHQFFPSLALAWRKTGNVKYVAAFTRMLHGWCDQNTPETGVNYISNLEIGLRCLSWIFTDRILKDCPAYDELTRERLHRNIYAQGKHLAEYLSYTEKTGRNNHLIGDAAALACIALAYPEWKVSKRWQDYALEVLWRNFDEQVFPDGMHFECSFGYHLAVAEFMLMLMSELRRKKRPVPAKAYAILEKMGTVIRIAQQPDGRLPNINDNDEGLALPLRLGMPERIAGFLSAMAVLYNRPDFKASSKSYGLYAHLLLGEHGAESFRIVPEYPEDFPGLFALNDSKIYIAQDPENFVLLKNNPDPFPLSGHNHADQLQVTLFLKGREVLTDAGTYRYNDDKGYRNALRGTAAHNTIVVDLKNQADPNRNFGWTSITKPGFSAAYEEPAFTVIDAEHDSYDGFGVTHRRVLLWLKGKSTLCVIDQMQGEDAHHFEQYWHFLPGVRVEALDTHHYRLSDDAAELAHVYFLRDRDNDQHDILFGSERNKSCSVSRSYGEIDSGAVLRHSWTGTLTHDHRSHRLTVFSTDGKTPDFSDEEHGIFRLLGWRIDLNEVPARVTRA